ncbi:MAG TPA: hypothetical protein PLI09_21220 [Candidatus Hydrogenedentes bacterium]|nr:hypothetical protein [Candidatus Hydrogenedentota bacterium]
MKYLCMAMLAIILLCACAHEGRKEAFAKSQLPSVTVRAEEPVYSFVSPDNGSGPLWSYGCTPIARLGDEVYVSQMETGEGIPPLCNTRWRLLHREQGQWRMIAEADAFRQREPCPLARLSDAQLVMNVNDSTQPQGTKYGVCDPHLIKFVFPDGSHERSELRPVWTDQPYYTDHSYRGFAADTGRHQLLMLNIDAKTSIQHACLLSSDGETLATGSIKFPIRACYPQVQLSKGAAYVLAIGDIVEPVKAWREYKFEQTQRSWDYVFRILYFTGTPNLFKQNFAEPMEIANVDATGGYISNKDLWVSPRGEAYILYTECEVASALLRDKFFPGKSIINSLNLAVVKQGKIVERRRLISGTEKSAPGEARFHLTPDGTLWAVIFMSGETGGNSLLRINPPDPENRLIPIPLKTPMSGYCLASVRAGNIPSYTIDMLGCLSGNVMAYAEIAMR